jgi:hypothetical protein
MSRGQLARLDRLARQVSRLQDRLAGREQRDRLDKARLDQLAKELQVLKGLLALKALQDQRVLLAQPALQAPRDCPSQVPPDLLGPVVPDQLVPREPSAQLELDLQAPRVPRGLKETLGILARQAPLSQAPLVRSAPSAPRDRRARVLPAPLDT